MVSILLTNFCWFSFAGHLLHAATIFQNMDSSCGRGGSWSRPPPMAMVIFLHVVDPFVGCCSSRMRSSHLLDFEKHRGTQNLGGRLNILGVIVAAITKWYMIFSHMYFLFKCRSLYRRILHFRSHTFPYNYFWIYIYWGPFLESYVYLKGHVNF